MIRQACSAWLTIMLITQIVWLTCIQLPKADRYIEAGSFAVWLTAMTGLVLSLCLDAYFRGRK